VTQIRNSFKLNKSDEKRNPHSEKNPIKKNKYGLKFLKRKEKMDEKSVKKKCKQRSS